MSQLLQNLDRWSRMTRTALLTALITCSFATNSARIFAMPHWQQIAIPPVLSLPVTPYFLTGNFGFVYSPGADIIARTTDGGATWKTIRTSDTSRINQIYFTDPAHGYIASARGIYVSLDSGLTWKKIGLSGLFFDQVYANARAVFGTSYDVRSGIRSLVRTRDHGATWDTIYAVRISYGNPRILTGNKDDIVYALDGLKRLWTISGDSVSWKFDSSASMGLFALAHTTTLLKTWLQPGTDYYPISQSTDFGYSWRRNADSMEIGAWIAGDGCALYVSNAQPGSWQGVYRSEDQGKTWIKVPGPDFTEIDDDDFRNLSVVDHGSTVYAVDRLGKFWRSTDGGDGKFLADSAGVVSVSCPTALRSTMCDTIRLPISLTSRACTGSRVHAFSISGLQPPEYWSSTVHHGANGALDDSIIVYIHPLISGKRPISIDLQFEDNEHIVTARSIGIEMDVPFSPGPRIEYASSRLHHGDVDTVDFGTRDLCSGPISDTIHIGNASCAHVKIDSMWFVTDPGTTGELSVRGMRSPAVLWSGVSTDITVQFTAHNLGLCRGYLIFRHGTRLDSLVLLATVVALPPSVAFRVDTMLARLCEYSQQAVRIYNPTCSPLRIDSVTFYAPYRLENLVVPLQIPVHDSVAIPVRFTPVLRGRSTTSAHVYLTDLLPGANRSFDTTIVLTGIGLPGTWSYVLSGTTCTFDSVLICDSAQRSLTFQSTGCDTLPLRSVSYTGDGDIRLVSAPASGPYAPGKSGLIRLSLEPTSTGAKQGVVTLVFDDGTNTTIAVNATVVRAPRTAQLAGATTIDFGAHRTCESRAATIVIRNPSCVGITVLGIDGLSAAFTTDAIFPVEINSGDSMTLSIRAITDTAGHVPGSTTQISVRTDADNTLPGIRLTQTYQYAHPVQLWLETSTIRDAAGDHVIVRLKGRPSELTDVNTIDVTLGYNSDLLDFTHFSSTNTVTAPTGTDIHIAGNPDIAAASDSTIAVFEYRVMLTVDTESRIDIGPIMLNASDPSFMGCVALPRGIGTNVTYVDICGSPTIRDALRGVPIRFSVSPNPSQGALTLSSDRPIGNCNITLTDPLGVIVNQATITGITSNETALDFSSIHASGIYLLSVNTAGATYRTKLVLIR